MSVLEGNWDYEFNINSIDDNCYKEFESKIKGLDKNVTKLLQDGFKVQKYNNIGNNLSPNHDDELRNLIERNKQLQHDIDVKVKDLSEKKTQYETYKKDQKLLSQEIKDTHEAFLMAKKCYKRFLKIYFTIESRNEATQTIYVQFFTEARKESENYSVRLLRDTKTGHYQLLDTSPKLQMFKELQQRLQDTNDLPGALCCIRLAFINMKTNKK